MAAQAAAQAVDTTNPLHITDSQQVIRTKTMVVRQILHTIIISKIMARRIQSLEIRTVDLTHTKISMETLDTAAYL